MGVQGVHHTWVAQSGGGKSHQPFSTCKNAYRVAKSVLHVGAEVVSGRPALTKKY